MSGQDTTTSSTNSSAPSSSMPLEYRSEDGSLIVILTAEPLDIAHLTYTLPRHPGCGAISTFLGTTRDNFEGKTVTRLEYEAYPAMAVEKMKAIGVKSLQRDGVRRVVIAHRVGVVPVEEPSVSIAVASEHRVEGLDECANAINRLKADVPIWKKEVYADETVNDNPQCSGCTAKWKQNKEWDPASQEKKAE